MKFNYKIYVVTDCKGHKSCSVAEDNCDTVMHFGFDKENKRQDFESDAYHLKGWCDDYGFKLDIIEREEIV